MKGLFLMSMLGNIFASCNRNIVYGEYTEQETVQFAYKLMKLYYPSDVLCVSDSIYDLDWDHFADLVVDTVDVKPHIMAYRENKGNVRDKPEYSKIFTKLFGHCVCIDSGYFAEFSAPYKGMIRCDVVPKDKSVDSASALQVAAFLFEYTEYAKIASVTKTKYSSTSRID